LTIRGFPEDRYTPHGYLDNPRHAWRVSRSGVVRSLGEGRIGFAWHYPNWPGPYGKRWIYSASLEIEVPGEGELWCEHHTKELFRFRRGGIAVELFVDDDALIARVDLDQRGFVTARATYRRQLGVSGDWDFGLLARHDADTGAGHLAVYAEGTAFALLADRSVAAAVWSHGDADWPDRAQAIEKRVEHRYATPDGKLAVVLARAESSGAALARARDALGGVEATRLRKLDADAAFWRTAPRLAGDWPEHWRRGLVYDLETLRQIVRPPAGIYRSRWDGMQIQVPRVVLAESALDMLLLSYADPEAAKEVMLGTLRDAIAPNVPCTREDGSVNMVAVDGEACGTSPAWCWPFWCIGLIYRRTGDTSWLAELLPFLESFLEWWLARRCHADGAPFYLCGWESGQDASPRFGSSERGGGGIEAIEPVDLDAAIAQAAWLLATWRRELGLDPTRWAIAAEEYTLRTRALWQRGWFHDRTAEGPTAARDPMQLAPLMCRVTTAEQVAVLQGAFLDLPGHAGYTPIEWPPVALTALESALQAGAGDWAAETAAGLVDRVWRATDAGEHAAGRPLPGVAHEHWPPEGEWHTEGYGWGATTLLLFLRYVAGVHDDPESDELRIEPRLPAALLRPGARYELLNLPWRGELIDLRYSVDEDGSLRVSRSSSGRV
jgi:hypothetical protein